ncbi:MAG: hypothetical protein FWG53_09830 [Clostridiales bacterium]|nr:hypothetical protein [Clostridiales bacterium]
MRVLLAVFDKGHYAIDLQQSGGTLKWAAKGGSHYLVARAPYGTNIVFDTDCANAVEKAGGSRILAQKEVRLAGKGLFIAMLPKSQVNICRIAASPASYAVFCCEYDEGEDTCTVYVPNEACCYQCSVAEHIRVKVTREPKKNKLRSMAKKGGSREHFIVEIPAIPSFECGSLHYTYEGCAHMFPVTEGMLGKQIFVPAFGGKPPVFRARKESGYVIVT